MNLLEQIREIRKLINIMENTKIGSNVMVIGDRYASLLRESDFNIINDLINEDMTIDMLINKISNQELNDKIDEIFISIGTNDLFDPESNIGGLVNILYDFYPNARLHLIKGYVNIFEFNLNEYIVEDVKKDSITFFELFKKDGVELIGGEITGKFSCVGDDIIKTNSNFIEKLRSYILGFVFNFEIKDTAEVDNNIFTDLDIDEKTDFDTIYEFLEIFEKIVKSNNTYSDILNGKYVGDVEVIQIALMFLGYSDGVIANGKYDANTKDAVYDFQRDNNLTETGIANKETLTEILWELKAKGFDEEDLAQFITGLKEKKKTYDIDSYNLENYCDIIINKIEGGYANKAHFSKFAETEKNPDMRKAFENSSETMFGIDRLAGNWDSHPVGGDFWDLIDENSGWSPKSSDKPKWPHGHMGGSLESRLRSYVYDMMLPIFSDLKNKNLDSETKKLVEEDKRLTMHLLYACWNGSGFFEQFSNVLNNEVSNGNTDRDSLYEVAINSRKNHSNDAIKKNGVKVENMINRI